MYLDTIAINNFRSFDEIEVSLNKDLTVLVGENNSGKSNLIDAIRLITKPLGGRRDLYVELTDIRFDSNEQLFNIVTYFKELTPPQQGRLISAATNSSLDTVSFGLTYDANTKSYPIKPNYWAGKTKGSPEPGCYDMIRHVYLPPLRDAKYALASGNPTRIYALLKHFIGEEDQEELAKRLARKTNEPVLNKIDESVQIQLSSLTSGVRKQVASLGFPNDEKLIEIARDLKFKLADSGIEPENLQYSGHGYANLLYMATIAIELEKVDNADLTLFLVEEPEAHLHPQLQAAVLSFLEEQSLKFKDEKKDKIGPAGQIQVIIATHSPNLSAWVENKKIVHFKSVQSSTIKPHGGQEKNSTSRRLTRCIPLNKLKLSDNERRKVDRYLDVTKSAMLFGGHILLVEGIAEALLLPVFARNFILKDKPDKLRLFQSAVIAPIDGVDFAPYVKLLLSPYNEICIADRVVVMTDGDKTQKTKDEIIPGVKRKNNLNKIVKELKSSKYFKAISSTYSLETELIRAGNEEILKSVYLKLHKNSEDKWVKAISKDGDDQAQEIQDLFRSTRKGDFSQILAEKLRTATEFSVPEYIKDAINTLVK